VNSYEEARGYHWPSNIFCFRCIRSKLSRKRQDFSYRIACWYKSNHNCTKDITCTECDLANKVIAKVLKSRQTYREECVRVRGVVI